MARLSLTKMLGTAAAVGAAVAGTSASSALAEEHEPEAIFFADYENGAIDSGYSGIVHNDCCAYSVQTTDFGRDSDTAVKHELRYGDPWDSSLGPRAESHAFDMAEARFGAGDTYYYAFSIYLPSTWEYDSELEDILFQWHTTPVGEACEPSKSPAAFLAVHPAGGGEWRLRVNSDEGECTTADTIDKTHLGLGETRLGQWTDFVFEFDWAYDDTGRIEAWTRTSGNVGWQHFEHNGPNTFNDPPDVGYLKWGIYKPGWQDSGSDVDKRAVIHDNISMGSSCQSVMPAGWPAPCGASTGGASDLGPSGERALPARTRHRVRAGSCR